MTDDATKNLVENLNGLLRSHGLSRAELARNIGIEQTTLNRIFNAKERGTTTSLETVSMLASGLNVTVSELLSSSKVEPLSDATQGLLLAKQLSRLIEDFLLSTSAGRAQILRIAQQEADRRLGNVSD